jgi:hypothetical protein
MMLIFKGTDIKGYGRDLNSDFEINGHVDNNKIIDKELILHFE